MVFSHFIEKTAAVVKKIKFAEHEVVNLLLELFVVMKVDVRDECEEELKSGFQLGEMLVVKENGGKFRLDDVIVRKGKGFLMNGLIWRIKLSKATLLLLYEEIKKIL